MNWKKAMVAVPLSVGLLVPTFQVASAHDHGAHQHKASVSTPASDLRASLDALLSEHAFLAVVAMQKGIDGAEDFDQAAGALNANTDDLSAAVASVYGEEGGAAFKEIWSSHIGYFVDYVTATAEDNEEGRQQALAELDEYTVEQAAFLDTATESRLKASELEAGLKMHVEQLVWAFDNYVAGDFEKAYENMRHAIEHMYAPGKGLSWAITDQFPEKFENTSVDTPAADLRADLNHLFAEHAALAVLAMQKGIDGAGDFENAAGALNANTADLSAAVASVYDEEGGAAFEEIWSSHIGYFVDYVVATGEDNEEGREAAIAELEEYKVEQAAFLDTATEGRLKAADLEKGLQMHVDELLLAFNSYNEADYETTYNTIRESYAHMFGVGEMMSGAIVDQFPENFEKDMPTDMPAAGMGGAADNGMNAAIAWTVAGLISAIVLTQIIAYRRKATQE
ncbi:copper amine oxidase [Bacillus sp. CHD6a]|uniref:copper amine oxidase n=1 Tax=Bacillus sp. CHD6a TaxID=1643452 RepID=UPI0006CCF5A1|nr:copper amine oxidase [Bacillus sp. CHD6a]KPB03239.1 copper amine oxidase n-terminal domain protein [Bacillus sp. CHD6a]